MKRFVSLLIFFALGFSFGSCIFIGPSVKGNGHVVKQTRNLSGFKSIKVSTGLDVFLIQDSVDQVVVEADENLLEVIDTQQKGTVLEIYTQQQIRWSKSKKVYVHFSSLEGVKSGSGSVVRSQSDIVADQFELTASSGSQQYIGLNCERLVGRSSSGAQVHLSGKTKKGDFKASSGSHMKAEDLVCDECTADVSSGAHIWISVNREFSGEASSGGHIYYFGAPERVTVNTSSGGNIVNR
ncbi:head GIN domain-containing protein [Gaoshiqia sp. Z1-71]|uniref:head GIN domain-containing protein n=1 Tax=Gaoshiqia hydrogeniformans TaxID=3290090 RepID=UPI003BF835D4